LVISGRAVLRNEEYGRKSIELVGEACKKVFLDQDYFLRSIGRCITIRLSITYFRSGGIDLQRSRPVKTVMSLSHAGPYATEERVVSLKKYSFVLAEASSEKTT